ncbi:MAG: hypothetical protein K1X47_04035 [Cyclobacteriaceae bacterium]|nr:hypothetical protein [Cyclobacteriaceae bacterium]
MKKLFFLLVLMAMSGASFAQCAMCRATLENNVSNGETGIAAGINFGILYLFVTPYLAVATLALLWYRHSRHHDRKKLDERLA